MGGKEEIGGGGTKTAGVAEGVGGPEEPGEGASTTHMLQAGCVSEVLRMLSSYGLPVGSRGHKLGNGVCESGKGVYMEDGKRVFAVIHAALGENDGDKMDAGGA